jgi:RNA-directed DNA polymerase
VIVRYADDFVMGFKSKADAQEMLLALRARLASFGLTLHEDKTRLIEFGRFAALSRQRRGKRRPETFAFLGFTHYCGRTRDGRFIVKHKTEGKRLTRKLTALRQEAWRFMHAPLATQYERFAAVLRGHYGYYGRPHNYPALNGFYREVRRTWPRCLRRRSQKNRRMGWPEFETLTVRFRLPTPHITRTWAQARI